MYSERNRRFGKLLAFTLVAIFCTNGCSPVRDKNTTIRPFAKKNGATLQQMRTPKPVHKTVVNTGQLTISREIPYIDTFGTARAVHKAKKRRAIARHDPQARKIVQTSQKRAVALQLVQNKVNPQDDKGEKNEDTLVDFAKWHLGDERFPLSLDDVLPTSGSSRKLGLQREYPTASWKKWRLQSEK